jgi:RimJ/RimL family protein N-acetyltransferase
LSAILGTEMPTTERLVLRSWRPSDRAPFARLNADPEVVRFVSDGAPLTRAQSDALLDAIEAHWHEHGFGLWCAAAREEPDDCLGFVGLAVPSFLPAVLPAVEVGWRLARPAWGRGLATEGARASLRHAFEDLDLQAVISIIDPTNERSIRVAQKLGMRRGRDHLHPRTGRRLCAYEISSHDAAFSPEAT